MKRRDYPPGKEMTVSEYNGWFNRVVSQDRVTRRQKHALSRANDGGGRIEPAWPFRVVAGPLVSAQLRACFRTVPSMPFESAGSRNCVKRVSPCQRCVKYARIVFGGGAVTCSRGGRTQADLSGSGRRRPPQCGRSAGSSARRRPPAWTSGRRTVPPPTRCGNSASPTAIASARMRACSARFVPHP